MTNPDTLEAEYRSARHGAALFDVSARGKVEITGPDAVAFVQNFSTNDVARLPAGAGCETFFTTIQAKVVAYALVYRIGVAGRPDSLWLDSAPGAAEKVIKHLDHYLISEQVEFTDRTQEFAQWHLAGPQSREILRRALGEEVPDLAPLRLLVRPDSPDGMVQIRRHDPLGVPGYDILCPAGRGAEFGAWFTRAGAVPAGPEAYEVLRVEAGTPLNGKDMDENTLAPEVGRTAQAVCYTKGCFLGQEPLVRIRDLGHVNRSLVGLKLAGGAPAAPGAKLFAGDKEVGRVTSSVVSPGLRAAIALAYLRRGQQTPGTAVEVEMEGGRRPAEVVFLPFSGSGAKP
jgi:folate-binding protein YgfZ